MNPHYCHGGVEFSGVICYYFPILVFQRDVS
jgi:hypothetical protein